MDGRDKKTESICKYVSSFISLIYIETEKYHKISDAYKINEEKIQVGFMHG